jgi:hypothetical protein
MPDELDPTTARLVAELASSILPSLTKSLSTSIPTGEFMNALERTNRAGNDLRIQIDRSIRSSIDDSRAGRSVMMQSIGTLSDEITALKKAITSLPENIERKLNENANKNQNQNVQARSQNQNEKNYDEVFSGMNEKLKDITDLLNELIKGIQQFSETYAKGSRSYDSVNVNVNPDTQEAMHNNGMLDKLLNETIPALEGLLKAQSKSQTKELHEFSREINAMNEQNNAALIHEVREAIEEKTGKNGTNDTHDIKGINIKKLLMINMCLSGACVFLSVIMFLILMFR